MLINLSLQLRLGRSFLSFKVSQRWGLLRSIRRSSQPDPTPTVYDAAENMNFERVGDEEKNDGDGDGDDDKSAGDEIIEPNSEEHLNLIMSLSRPRPEMRQQQQLKSPTKIGGSGGGLSGGFGGGGGGGVPNELFLADGNLVADSSGGEEANLMEEVSSLDGGEGKSD